MASKYRTSPPATEKLPSGIPFIVGNEAAERFSFYGMKAILVIFMTQYLRDAQGDLDTMTDEQAKAIYHLFTSSAYFFPVFGAIIADWLWGKYRTIIRLSIVYCLGHLALALDETRLGLAVGLTLIAIGSGGIKPCVSAHVGDQFGPLNQHLLSKVFGWFYLAINVGAFVSSLLTPWLLEYFGPRLGPHVAFGVPGLLMFIATLVFWLGRYRYVHIPPGGRKFLQETFSWQGVRVILSLAVLYVFVAVFWSLFDQMGSSWVLQAQQMDRQWEIIGWLPSFLGAESWLPSQWHTFTWLPSQLQALNPLMILLFVPLFAYVVYPAINRFFLLTPLRRISIGFFIAAVPFAICAYVAWRLGQGDRPDVIWQVWAYATLTAAEVMVSITCLEFSYTQAPKTMKSIIMAVFLLSVALGNAFAAFFNWIIQDEEGQSRLSDTNYFLFFTGLMLAAAVVFVFVSQFYRPRDYVQGTQSDKDD